MRWPAGVQAQPMRGVAHQRREADVRGIHRLRLAFRRRLGRRVALRALRGAQPPHVRDGEGSDDEGGKRDPKRSKIPEGRKSFHEGA